MEGREMCRRFYTALIENQKSKKQFCDETGISPSTLSNWERRGTAPSGELLIKIAENLHVSADYILGINDEANSEYRDLQKRMVTYYLAYLAATKRDQELVNSILKYEEE